jgi:hypothetical protein
MADYDPKLEGRTAAGSPVGIGDTIVSADMHGQRSVATNVQPVYKDGVSNGWVYTSNHGDRFFQENTASRATWGAGVGKGPVSIGVSEPGSTPVKLQPGPIEGQLPEGSEVRPGPSAQRDAALPKVKGLEPGKHFAGSPFGIGDDIPGDKGRYVQVTNINVVANKDTGKVQGYLYEGSDGKVYGQRVDPMPLSGGLAAGAVSASVTASGQKPVELSDPPGTLDYGAIPPPNLRNDRIPMVDGQKPLGLQHWTDAFKHKQQAALPENAQELKVGQQATGQLVGVDDKNMYVNGGRVAYSVPLDKLPNDGALPSPGDKVSVSMQRDGNAGLDLKSPTQSLGVGRA